MLNRLIAAILLMGALVIPGAPVASKAGISYQAEQKKDCVVYVTRTGHRYHREWCRYLSRSKIRTTRKKAMQAGLTACHVCGGSDCEPAPSGG